MLALPAWIDSPSTFSDGDAAQSSVSGQQTRAGSSSAAGSAAPEQRLQISRAHSQDVGPTPSDWDPSYRWARLVFASLIAVLECDHVSKAVPLLPKVNTRCCS